MSTELDIYNRILFLDLRPWMNSSVSEMKFKQDLNDLEKTYYQVQPSFELSFPNPLSNKRKYYTALIDHEAIRFLNNLHKAVEEAVNDNEKKYHVHWALTRTLPQKLKELAQVLNERQYHEEQYQPKTGLSSQDKVLADESFIIHYLKHELVRLFMEIQEAYPSLLKQDPVTEEEIYYTYFEQTAPQPSVIVEATKKPLAKAAPIKPDSVEASTFQPISNDVRPEKKGILPFSTIIKNPSRFGSFESKLHENGYIDTDYNFTNKHGAKNELACIYLHLMNKGYFNKRQFPGNKEIKDVAIRKFLDHRYATDIDKQFRTYRNDPDALADYVDTQFWLTQLPNC